MAVFSSLGVRRQRVVSAFKDIVDDGGRDGHDSEHGDSPTVKWGRNPTGSSFRVRCGEWYVFTDQRLCYSRRPGVFLQRERLCGSDQGSPYHVSWTDKPSGLLECEPLIEASVESLKNLLLTLGVPGLFFICVLDSAGVPLPGGPDAVVMLLSWQHPNLLIWIALTAAAGSTIGNWFPRDWPEFESLSEIDSEAYNDCEDATAGHLAMCHKWAHLMERPEDE